MAPRSASEYTATVRNPMRLAVRMIRHAISPRLAINNLWKRRASDTITSFFSRTLIFLAFFVLPTAYLRQYAARPAYFPRLIRRCSPVEGDSLRADVVHQFDAVYLVYLPLVNLIKSI